MVSGLSFNLKRKQCKNVHGKGENYEHYISISDNAIKNKKPMYIDTRGIVKQIGYVVTGKTEFQSDSDQWVSNYIDLWIEILTVVETEF